jgi:hypothetical protein
VTADDFFAKVISALERTKIPYMLTGSFASAAHGRLRATQDIDIVIAPTAQQLRKLVAEFPSDEFYADEEDAFQALAHTSQFNIIDFSSTWKADLIMRKSRAFSVTEFDRRMHYVVAGVQVFVTTAEDILIAKLEWAKLGESERQIEDAAGVAETQGTALDRAYVEHWVRELGLETQWAKVLERVG